jgi:CRISPR-associated protein Cas1
MQRGLGARMIKRTIEISKEEFGVHLTVRDSQLLVLRRLEPPKPLPARPPNLAGSIPCEDIGVVMVDSRETTYSHSALAELAEQGAAVVVCGRNHLPVGMFVPLSTNSQLLSRLDAQLHASRPTCKQLWSAIVSAKVRAQAEVIPSGESSQAVREKLLSLASHVRSGDPDNVEAQAAALYWPSVFASCNLVQQPFRRRARDEQAAPPNHLLDYGYAVLRASIARALVSAGLLPALGIKHMGRSNAFCLADDLMEPLRPLIDHRVRLLTLQGELGLDQPVKAELLGVLNEEVQTGTTTGPLMVAMSHYVASFIRVLMGESLFLDIPQSCSVLGGKGARSTISKRRTPQCRADSPNQANDEQEE